MMTASSVETTMTFNHFNFHPLINKAIQQCGYQTPTPVQQKSIPIILQRQDIIASAQTGTGKTGAFILPILQHLSIQPKQQQAQILILTPTRELAAQITQAAKTYGKFMKFNIASIVGGASYYQQIRGLSKGVEIIVATPGRLLDHIENKRLDLSKIHTLVLDEADRMLDMGFIDDVRTIAKLTPNHRQTLLFSATLDNQLMQQVKDLLNKPVRIDLSTKQLTAPKIQQEFFSIKNIHEKNKLLKKIIEEESIFKAIIFTATKVYADQLADELDELGLKVKSLHGDLKQNVRNRTVEKLRKGQIQFLVATDVVARGLDISDVTHVINFDLPRFCEDYVHRIGRTGRAGKDGKAISFVLPNDMIHLKRIEKYINTPIQIKSMNGEIIANHQIKNQNSGAKKKSSHRFSPKPSHAPRRSSAQRDDRNNSSTYQKKPRSGFAKSVQNDSSEFQYKSSSRTSSNKKPLFSNNREDESSKISYKKPYNKDKQKPEKSRYNNDFSNQSSREEDRKYKPARKARSYKDQNNRTEHASHSSHSFKNAGKKQKYKSKNKMN